MGLGLFVGDTTIRLLSTFGITALFLFAGLDVDFEEMRRGRRILMQHLVIKFALLAAATVVVHRLTFLAVRPSMLVALALLTPSTGFILASLAQFGLNEQQRFWVKSKAIATELLALTALFVGLQSTTARTLAVSGLAMVAMMALLPVLFRVFAARIAPFAPKSEFTFLLMLAILCASVTLRLGAYYLVGAFVVGVVARRLGDRLPALASSEMLHAVEVFAAFFVPFYFFNAGLHLSRQDFAIPGVLMGLAFFGFAVPVNILAVVVHRRLALGERSLESTKIAVPLLPTLVFTLVLAEILRDRFSAPPMIFGGLIVYTLLNTLVPGFALGAPTVSFDVDVDGSGPASPWRPPMVAIAGTPGRAPDVAAAPAAGVPARGEVRPGGEAAGADAGRQ